MQCRDVYRYSGYHSRSEQRQSTTGSGCGRRGFWNTIASCHGFSAAADVPGPGIESLNATNNGLDVWCLDVLEEIQVHKDFDSLTPLARGRGGGCGGSWNTTAPRYGPSAAAAGPRITCTVAMTAAPVVGGFNLCSRSVTTTSVCCNRSEGFCNTTAPWFGPRLCPGPAISTLRGDDDGDKSHRRCGNEPPGSGTTAANRQVRYASL
jgi:hypothetical protein